ncbi:hypothetical protein BKA82DRAFT_4166908 [Pisolithus tinctorius]|nr:hypothetical protein BKA82DRAFT_4166908 [Pisolithus tinctorius]
MMISVLYIAWLFLPIIRCPSFFHSISHSLAVHQTRLPNSRPRISYSNLSIHGKPLVLLCDQKINQNMGISSCSSPQALLLNVRCRAR